MAKLSSQIEVVVSPYFEQTRISQCNATNCKYFDKDQCKFKEIVIDSEGKCEQFYHRFGPYDENKLCQYQNQLKAKNKRISYHAAWDQIQ